MTGRRNTQGIQLTCPNGHTWYYTGNKIYTSCSICGYKVKTGLSAGRQPVDSFVKTDQLF